MRTKTLRRIAGFVGMVAAIMLTTSPAFGGAWAIPSGNTDSLGGDLSFSYSNGGDINGLFNDPFIFGDAFFFTTSFTAGAANGASASQADTLSVDILADPGLKFGSVSVQASGSYSIDGTSHACLANRCTWYNAPYACPLAVLLLFFVLLCASVTLRTSALDACPFRTVSDTRTRGRHF